MKELRPWDQQWNREKEERELDNQKRRNGWVGKNFFTDGVRRLPRHSTENLGKPVVIFERNNVV